MGNEKILYCRVVMYLMIDLGIMNLVQLYYNNKSHRIFNKDCSLVDIFDRQQRMIL